MFAKLMMGIGGATNILYKTITLGSLTSLVAVSPGAITTINIASGKILCVYQSGSSIYGLVLTHSASAITAVGTPTLLSSAIGTLSNIDYLEDNKAIMVSYDSTLRNLATVISVSGTTPSIGASVQVSAASNTASGLDVCGLSSTQAIVAIGSGGASNAITVLIGVSGTAVTVQDTVTDPTNKANASSLIRVSSNLAFWLAADNSANALRAAMISVSGTAIVEPTAWSNVEVSGAYMTNSDTKNLALIDSNSVAFVVSSTVSNTVRAGVVNFAGALITSVGAVASIESTGSTPSLIKIAANQLLATISPTLAVEAEILNISTIDAITSPYGDVTVYSGSNAGIIPIEIGNKTYALIGMYGGEIQYKIANVTS